MQTELSPIDVSTIQERVYQSLRLALLKGQFLPGEQVSIRTLATALGTSPMPVREAVKRLVAEKAFEQSSDRLLRVASYVADVHEEYIRIRIQLETFATERACIAATPELLDALSGHNAAMRKALRAGDFEAALATNQAFHFAIYGAAGYPQLLDIISSLWLRTGPILAVARSETDLFRRLFESGCEVHVRAIDALARRDRKQASRAIALDIRSSHLGIRRHLKQEGFGQPGGAASKLRRQPALAK